jgi:hypothetical protein
VSIATIEGVVENGQIRLLDNMTLPEKARVFVVIPELQAVSLARIYSPRLLHPEQAVDFAKELIEAPVDARL